MNLRRTQECVCCAYPAIPSKTLRYHKNVPRAHLQMWQIHIRSWKSMALANMPRKGTLCIPNNSVRYRLPTEALRKRQERTVTVLSWHGGDTTQAFTPSAGTHYGQTKHPHCPCHSGCITTRKRGRPKRPGETQHGIALSRPTVPPPPPAAHLPTKLVAL